MMTTILILGIALHYFLLAVAATWLSMVVLAACILLAGVAGGYLAPRMKLLVGAAVAFPAAVLLGAADVLFGYSGHYAAGWPGPLNSLVGAIIVFPIGAVLGMLGGAFGAAYSRRTSDA